MKVKQKALDEVNEITYDTKTGITATTLVHTFKPCIDLFDSNEHIAHYKNDTEFIEDFKKMKQENQSLKKQLEYLRSGEYYNQLRFERDMLQYVADNGKVSKEDKEFIDMTHRNTELLEVIEEVRELIPKQLLSNVNITKYTDEMCLRDILQILDKVKD